MSSSEQRKAASGTYIEKFLLHRFFVVGTRRLKHPDDMAPIQKAIRDLERTIRKKKEKGESTEALDKRLALLFDDKTISDQIQKEKRNSAKYHMIKFIERQKLVRKIRSIDQQLATGKDGIDIDGINIIRSSLMEQLAYVLYYPKEFKYVALFAESGEIVGKNEKLRLKAHKLAVEQWKSETAAGSQDRVMRVIMCEEKEEVVKSFGKKKRSDGDEDNDSNNDEEVTVNERNKASKQEIVTYGDKIIQPKKKKSKAENLPEKIEEKEDTIDFPAGQEPDAFFLEEQIIESKISALQSINQKYPPEKNQRHHSSNHFSNSSSYNNGKNFTKNYGNYGPGLKDGNEKRGFKNYNTNNAGYQKPAYGAGSFSSLPPSKQNARLQKWQQRKGSR